MGFGNFLSRWVSGSFAGILTASVVFSPFITVSYIWLPKLLSASILAWVTCLFASLLVGLPRTASGGRRKDSRGPTGEHIRIREDGKKEVCQIGRTGYGKGHAPDAGHKPLRIIDNDLLADRTPDE